MHRSLTDRESPDTAYLGVSPEKKSAILFRLFESVQQCKSPSQFAKSLNQLNCKLSLTDEMIKGAWGPGCLALALICKSFLLMINDPRDGNRRR